jgi:hypothetical protein
VRVPDEPFPHTNSSAEWAERNRRRERVPVRPPEEVRPRLL